MDSLAKFISSILIESTYFIVLKELCDFKGYVAYSWSQIWLPFSCPLYYCRF